MDLYVVCRLIGQDGFFLVLQYPGLEASATVIVAPLVPFGTLPVIPVLTPAINFDGEAFLLLTYRMAAIQIRQLGPVLGKLEHHEYEIQRALSRLFFGN